MGIELEGEGKILLREWSPIFPHKGPLFPFLLLSLADT